MNREKLQILCENLAEVKLEIEKLSSKLNYLHYQLHDITTAIQEAVDEKIVPMTSVNMAEQPQTADVSVNQLGHELPNQTVRVVELPFADEQNGCVKNNDMCSVHNCQATSQRVVQPFTPVSVGVEVVSQSATEEEHIDIQIPNTTPEPPVQSPAQSQILDNVAPGISNVDNSQLPAMPIETRYCSMVIYNDFEFSDTDYQKSNRSIYVIEVMTENIARYYPIPDQAKRLLMKRVELLDPVCDAEQELDMKDFIITEDKYGLMKRNQYGRWNIVKRCSLLH